MWIRCFSNKWNIKRFFKEKYKSVIDAKIIIDPSTKISKGYGFAKFSDKNESEKAMKEINGQLIKGKAMKTGNASYKEMKKSKIMQTIIILIFSLI